MHQGDLEIFSIQLRDSSPRGTYTFVSARYEAHGEGTEFFHLNDLTWVDETHPVVRVALNLHGTHNQAAGQCPGGVTIPVIGYVADYVGSGHVWRPETVSVFKRLGLDGSKNPIGSEVWVKFSGHLGDAQHNTLTGGKDMEGNNLSTVTYATLVAIVKAGNFLGLISSGWSWGNGPGGAAGRPWILPQAV
jgi:hypothetical protein